MGNGKKTPPGKRPVKRVRREKGAITVSYRDPPGKAGITQLSMGEDFILIPLSSGVSLTYQ